MLPMEGCEGCGGVWLGPEAAVHVLRGLGDDREREIARATALLEMRAVGAPPADPGKRECPTCAQVMGRLPVGATVVDSCPAHGTWFDSREIGEVIVACGALRRRHSIEKADTASPESTSTTADAKSRCASGSSTRKPSRWGSNAGVIRPDASSSPCATSAAWIVSATGRPTATSRSSTTRTIRASAVTGTFPNVTPQSSSYSFCSVRAKSS